MASKSDKIDVGGREDYKAKLAELAAMKAVDAPFEGDESGKEKAWKKGKKEGALKKKRGPRKSEAEVAAQAETQTVVSVGPEVLVAGAEVLPIAPSVVEGAVRAPKEAKPTSAPEVASAQEVPYKDFLIAREAAQPKNPPSAEEVAERLVQAMEFSDKVEELPIEAPSDAANFPKKEKNIELWQKPSLREQVTKEQKESVEQFLEKQKGFPLSCLDEMLRILSSKKDPNVFNNEQELQLALEKAKLWLAGSRKIFDAVKINTPEAQIRKIYNKMSDNGEHDFTGDYDKIRQIHQEVLAQMENRLAGVRRGLMKKFPGGLVVRGGEVKVNDHKEKKANLDSNAGLFLFNEILGFGKKDASEEEKKYVEKTSYIKYDEQPAKGGIHLDISPYLQGAWIKNDELYFDHHGESSPRKSSAAEIIYRSFEKGHLLDHLDQKERLALDRLMKFTTALDSYTLPIGTRARVNWKTVWEGSDKTLFGAALFFQNDLPIEDLFNFFKEHDLEEAFVRPLDGLNEPCLSRINQLRKEQKVGEGKEVIQNFFQILNGPNAPKAKVMESSLGKIVVMAQESREDKFPPGFQAAALAQGFDGILTWEPRSHKWFLAVGEQQKITKELADSIGEGEWVRESMIKKEAGKDAGISLGELLEKLGVDLKNLEVYDGALAKAINRDKQMVTKIKPVLTEGAAKPAETTPVGEASKELSVAVGTAGEVEQPRLELANPKFKVGDLVKLKAGSKLTGTIFGKSRIIGGEHVSGVNFYEVEGVSGRKFPEEEIELVKEGKAVLPETVPTEVARPTAPETSPVAAPLPSTAPTEIIAPTLEKTAEVINVDAAENALTNARTEYTETYKDFLRFKGKPTLLSRLRKGMRGLFKGSEEATMAELDENAREEITAARERYLQAKINYAKALYQQEARLLAQEGKSPEEIAKALKQFGQQEIFEKLVIGEETVLQAACATEWPPMEKGLLRRGFEVWVKLPMPARLLITTGVLTGALYAGGAIGVGAVAATFGIRLARSVAGAIFGQGVSKGIGKFLSGRIAKETGARTEEARGEMGIALANEKFDALNILTEKYHKIFEDKVKKEKRKLLAQTVAAIGVGAGASLGLGWLADAAMGPGAGVQLEKVSSHAPVVAEGKGFEQIIVDIKARGQNLVDELTKQAQEAAESARLEHVSELATLQKGEGIIHVLSRQLEDDPLRFGYTGNLDDIQATHEWARHLAGQISIKEGYWDPSQQAQKWFVYNPAKPMHFVLSGDAEKGFHIDQSGDARSFIHTGEVKVLPQEKYLDWDEEKVSADQPPAPTEVAPTEPTVAEYTGRPLQWETWTEPVRGHMHMLAEELKASHELALQYAIDPNLHPAALAVEQDVLKKIVEYQNAIKVNDVSGYDQELKDGVDWNDYHETVKSELDKEVWKHAASRAGSGGGGVTRVENVAAPAHEASAAGSATTATEAIELARISKDQFLNTSLSTSDRIDALKELMVGHNLKLDNISYHQAGQGVRVEIGDYNGWIDEKNIDILKEFHKQFKGITTPGTEATAKLVEKLQAAMKK